MDDNEQIMRDLMDAAEERRVWKDVSKIAYGLGRRDVSEQATRRAREIGVYMVTLVDEGNKARR